MAKKRITEADAERVRELAELGLSKSAIAQALEVNMSTLRRNRLLSVAVQSGQNAAREKVMRELRAHAELDAATSFKVAQALGCFRDSIELPEIKTPQDALKAFSVVTRAYGRGEVSESFYKSITNGLERFTRLFDAVELEKRVETLEKMMEGCGDGTD